MRLLKVQTLRASSNTAFTINFVTSGKLLTHSVPWMNGDINNNNTSQGYCEY